MISFSIVVYLMGYVCFLRCIAEGINNYPKHWTAYVLGLLWPSLTFIGILSDVFLKIWPDKPEE